jgi:hypothetical protein
MQNSVHIIGVDFTSRPTRVKPITVAVGELSDGATGDKPTLTVASVLTCADTVSFTATLESLTPWVGGFDFPFGLPREFVKEQGWPTTGKHAWRKIAEIACAESRAALVERCRAFCDARPAGSKFAHRKVDRLAGSSPSMKWVNPPVLYMFHAGLPVLLALDCTFPGLSDGNGARTAFEAYPGYVARSITKASYKSDDRAKQTSARMEARREIVAALKSGKNALGMRLKVGRALREQMLEDASGDSLDAVICAMQAAWGLARRETGFGLPLAIDPIEGWILGVEDLDST